jgi:hypothetical protein
MRFEIDFNYGYDDELLKKLGAEEVDFDGYSAHFIEIDTFEDIEALLIKLDKETNDMYSAVVSFDPPTIYLDNKV